MAEIPLICPVCTNGFTVSDATARDTANCPSCHAILEVGGAAAPEAAANSLRLLANRALPKTGCYATLSEHGVHVDSPMSAVQSVFPEGDDEEAEETAKRRLSQVESRLQVDLLMFPFWTERANDGP